MYGTYALGGAREEQVAHAQGHELRHAGDEPVHAEEHVARESALADLAVHLQLEAQALHVAAQPFERHELRREGRRVVERLGALPRRSGGDGGALEVAGREVDAQPDLGVVAAGEALVLPTRSMRTTSSHS